MAKTTKMMLTVVLLGAAVYLVQNTNYISDRRFTSRHKRRIISGEAKNYFIAGEKFKWHVSDVNLLRNPVGVCPVETKLMIFCIVKTDGVVERNTVRETWGRNCLISSQNKASSPCKIVFVVGQQMGVDLTEEQKQHGDIIQFDFLDTYHNLTLKSVSMLKYFDQYCSHVPYLLKTDSDSYVIVERVLAVVYRKKPRMTIIGSNHYGDNYAYRKGTWAVPEELYPEKYFPIYAHGPCYMITADLVAGILSELFRTTGWWAIEDAFITGYLRVQAGGRFVADRRWGAVLDETTTIEDLATSHTTIAVRELPSTELMKKIWKQLHHNKQTLQ